MSRLDKDEQEILEKFEKGALSSSINAKKEIKYAKIAARNYLNKDKRINIRISGTDLELLKRKALEEGLPYQTMIASILHKIAMGKKIVFN